MESCDAIHGTGRRARGRGREQGGGSRCRSALPCLPCCRPPARPSRWYRRPGQLTKGLPPCSLTKATAARAANRISIAAMSAKPLAAVADHHAERVGKRERDQQDRDDLHEVRQRGRILEGMRGIGVEKAAAVGTELLDGFLRCDRAHGQGLCLGRDGLGDRLALAHPRVACPRCRFSGYRRSASRSWWLRGTRCTFWITP